MSPNQSRADLLHPQRFVLCVAVLIGISSPAHALTKGQQWFIDNGLQIMGLIGNPSGGNPFHLSTYQNMGYTTQLWEWGTDPAQLTTSWGRWVGDPSQMPPLGGESSQMGNLRHLGLGDEPELNNPAIRDQFVAWYNSAHANPTFNNVLLWNNNYGGQVNDAALGDFITRAQPDMISFDTYPYAPGAQPLGGSPTNWYGDFRRYRQWGMDTNTPVGVYRQTYSSPGGAPQTRAVSQSELSLQTFTSLAFNAKSLEDFTYNFAGQTLFDPAFGGDNQITALGTAAQAMNAEAKRLGPALVRLKPVADPTLPNWTSSMMFIRGKNTNASTYNPIPIGFVQDAQNPAYTDWVQGRNDPYMLEPTTATNLGSKNLGLPGDVIISWFRVMDETMDGSWVDEKYFMVTNALADMTGTAIDTRQSVSLTFDFGASGITQLERLSRSTGLVENVSLTPQGGSLYSYLLTLDGGRGDLFKFKTGAPFVGIGQAPPSGTLYWDNDANAGNNSLGSGAGLGGTGTWDSTSLKWYNGTSDVAWITNSDATFWGTAGTVTLSAGRSANSLTFKTNGYTVTGSTLTMTGSGVTVDNGVTATVSSIVAGSAGITKSGAGTLIFTNAGNSYTGGTTINGGVVQVSSDASLGAVPGGVTPNITLNGGTLRWGATFDVNNNRAFTFGASGGTFDTNGFGTNVGYGPVNGFRGTGNLTKTGAGTFYTGSAGNTWTGNLIIKQGTFRVFNEQGLQAAPAALQAGAITLDGGTFQINSSFGPTNGNRGITVAAGGGSIDTNTYNLTWAGPVAGAAGTSMTKAAAGTLILDQPSPRSGTSSSWLSNLTVTGGTLQVGNGGNSGFLPGYDPVAYAGPPPTVPNISVASGATLRFNNNNGHNDAVAISGAGGVVLAGTGIETLVADSTYTGPTTINSGSHLRIGFGGAPNGGSLGATAITNSGTLTFFRDNNSTFPGTFTGGGAVNKQGTGTLTLTGANTPTGATTISGGTLQVGAGGTVGSLSGNITDNAVLAFNRSDTITYGGVVSGTGSVSKLGGGELVLTGANTYSGGTTVSTGVLRVNNVSGSGTGTGAVTVNGGTLAGTGTLGGAVSVNSGAHLAPGGTAGTLSASAGATFASGAILDYDLASTNTVGGGVNDLFGITGNLSLGTSLTFNINAYQSDLANATYRLMTYTGTLSGNTSGWTIGSNNATGTHNYSFSSGTPGQINLIVSALATAATWTGATSASWDTSSNWNIGTEPISITDVTFPTPVPPTGSTITLTAGEAAKSLTFNDSYTLGGGDLTLSGGTITVAAAKTATIGSVLAGTGGITKDGTGTLVISGVSSYTGGTTISAGTLQIGSGGTTGSITGNITDNAGLAFNRSDTITYGGVVSGTGSLTKLGAGTLVLTGANTYSGGTTVSAGTLQIGSGGTTGSVSGNITDNAAVSFNRSDTVTHAGAISGTGSLTKLGSGTLVLSGANTYTGATTISTGVLRVAGGAAIANTSAVTLANTAGAALDLNGTAETIGSLAGGGTSGGNVTLGAGSLTAGGNNTSTTFAGVISGTGSITKSGTGTMTLSGANTYSGGTTVNGGAITVSSDSHLGAAPGAVTPNITLDGGTLRWGAIFDVNNNRAFTFGAAGGTLDTNGFGTNVGYGPINGFRGTGNLTKTGAGTFYTGSGGNTWTGNLIIQQGTFKTFNENGLQASPAAVQAGAVTLDGGTFQINSTFGPTHANRGITVDVGGGTIDTQIYNLTWGGPVGGAGTLTKIGSGMLRLQGAGTNTGVVNVNAGTLQVAGGSAIGDTAAVTVANVAGATFDVTASETIGSLSGGGGAGGNITLGANTLTTGGNNTSTAYAGVLSGTGGLTKAGTGTMTLSGANTYSGATTVSGGTLQIGAGGTAGSIAGNITNNAAVAFSRSDAVTYAGVISGAGSLTKLGTGTLTLSGIHTHTGGTNVNAGTLQITSTGGIQGSGPVTLPSGGTLTRSGGIFNFTTLNQTGGTFSHTVANHLLVASSGGATYTLNSGNLTTNASYGLWVGATGSFTTGNGTFTQSGGTVNTNRFEIGRNSGLTGTVNLSGTGSISAANVYVGGTTAAGAGTGVVNISGGSMTLSGWLRIWNTGAAAPGGTRVNLSGGTLSVFGLNTSGNPARWNWTGGTFNLGAGGWVQSPPPPGEPVGASQFVVGTDGPMGESLDLWTGKNFVLHQTDLVVDPTGSLAVTGGELSAATGMQNDGTFTQTSGVSMLGPVTGVGSMAMSGGTLSMTQVRQQSLQLTGNAAAMIVASGGATNTSYVDHLGIEGNAILDLADNALVIGDGELSAIAAWVASGRNQGSWDGFGIVSSEAAMDRSTGLAVTLGENTSIVVTPTLNGDMNLDRLVDRTDAAMFASHFGRETESTWATGDFDYDGATTLADWGLLRSNFGRSPHSAAPAAVPEPSAWLLAVIAIPAWARCYFIRRKRR